MRLPGPIRSTTALCLLSLLGALGTGLPSHSHPGVKPSSEPGAQVLTADHHSHGTQLVEQDERAPAGSQQLAARSAVTTAAVRVAWTVVAAPEANVLRPMERAPPPGAPRAPPFVV